MFVGLLSCLFGAAFAAINTLPAFRITKVDTGCKGGIIPTILEDFAALGVFTSDDGPTLLAESMLEPRIVGDIKYHVVAIDWNASRDGCRTRRAKVKAVVETDEGNYTFKAHMVFRHQDLPSDSAPTWSPFPSVYHYRPESIEVSLRHVYGPPSAPKSSSTLPPFEVTHCDDGCNVEIIGNLLKHFASKGAFFGTGGPDDLNIIFEDHVPGMSYVIVSQDQLASRDGRRTRIAKMTANVDTDDGKKYEVKFNILYKNDVPEAQLGKLAPRYYVDKIKAEIYYRN